MDEVKLREAVAAGLSLRELADKFGFASTGPLRYWLNKYNLRTVRAENPTLMWKYSIAQLTEAVAASTSVSGVLRYLNATQPSASWTYMSQRIKKLNLDTSHFCRIPSDHVSTRKKVPSEILVFLPDGSNRTPRLYLHRALQEMGVPYKCVLCNNTGEWLGKSLDLEIDHLDGNWRNNLFDNLRYLCPNCHSQTPTYRNKKRTVISMS